MGEENSRLTAALKREEGRLRSFIRRRVRNPSDAEDVLQDVVYDFVRAYRLPEPIEEVGAWLVRVARNRIIDRFRRDRTRTAGNESIADDDDASLHLALPAASESPDAAVARAYVLQKLQEALDTLPSEQREVFLAHEIEGLSFNEIAASSGISINTLLSRKRYAVLNLRRQLQAVYQELDH
jgi:RNA polymerase sigma factor (sigma-70 family)